MTLIINLIELLIIFRLLALICDIIFVPSLEEISKKLKISSELAWATLMAIGSSAPELFTSIFSIVKSNVDINLWAGTIVWSAIFNILVIIWASAIIKNVQLSRKPIIRDLVIYIISLIVLLITFWDWKITFQESLIFVILYVIYIFIAKNWSKRLNYTINDEEIEEESWFIKNKITKFINKFLWKTKYKNIILFISSIILIWLLTNIMVDSWVIIASSLWMSNAIIGLTILAIWTSIPDLLSSISVAKKWKWDMAITNAVGSNIFDILFGLWLPYLIYFIINKNSYIQVSNENLENSIFLLFSTVLVVFLFLLLKKRKLTKLAGFFLILLYIIYLWYNILTV